MAKDLRAANVFCAGHAPGGCVGADDSLARQPVPGRRLCGCCGVVARDEDVHVASASHSSRDGVQGCAFDGGVVVFSNNEYDIRSPSLCLSFSTRVQLRCTTLTPALRLAGSVTFRVFFRWVPRPLRGFWLTVSSPFLGLATLGQGDAAGSVQAQVGGVTTAGRVRARVSGRRPLTSR